MVTHAGQILDASAAYQHHRVLLQIVSFTTDISDDLVAVGESHLRHFSQRRIRFLRCRGVHTRAYTTALWAGLEGRHLALALQASAALGNQLINGRHKSAV